MQQPTRKQLIGLLKFIFYPVPYPVLLIAHAIYGVCVFAPLLGYRGHGWRLPLGCIIGSIAFFYLLYLLFKIKPRKDVK